MSTQVDTDENRRRRTRHNVMKRGTLLMDASSLTLPCTVRNLSRDGALIFAEHLPDDRPRDFILVIDSLQLQVSCLVKWVADEENGCDIGVRFLSRWREYTPEKPQPFALKLKKNFEQWVKT
ncbi:MAG: PilZ domain-containing protein [Methyloligellaceae bacterium]